MQKNITIITIILMAILLIGTIVGVFVITGSNYSAKAKSLQTDLDNKQKELADIKVRKDNNGYTPTDVVKAFFNEVKSDANEKAKLYLAPEVQSMDIKATLKLGSDLSNVTTGDNIEEVSGSDYEVTMTFVFADDTTSLRKFTISKYEDIWKITEISVVE